MEQIFSQIVCMIFAIASLIPWTVFIILLFGKFREYSVIK